jgi:preprotein translocase subunit SecF
VIINFVGRRKLWYIISSILVLVGIGSLIFQGLNLGIDFTGGNIIQVQFAQDTTSAQVRDVFSHHISEGFSVQETGSNSFLMRTPTLSEEEADTIISSLTSQLGSNELLRNEHVGAVIGKELALNAIYALVIAFALMVLYISFRFEFRSGVAAIIALVHDVLLVVGLFSILQIEVDSAFVAAILSIVGYSINDTIVVFDRIRENMRLHTKDDRDTLVNRSVTQSLTRSINTALTTMFPLIALFLFGGETIKAFALALLVGTFIGCFSTIFLASPLWMDFSDWLAARKSHKKAHA